ncbi:MAG: conserved phage C-terminal domain-containing protein [Lentilactobacillus sunkii]|jgi:uncharacterized phage protein (TIGR02220 family)|uniref:conserved phage C-terminal domain-containing protein n=1 Tax=Lentilactobacillus sunkii TaxID=481719 RepID=UPI002F35BBE7
MLKQLKRLEQKGTMARLIKKTRENYTNVSNQLVRDQRLSWKARGIFVYLWSQADNWQFYVGEVQQHATDGKDALQSGLKELEKLGYLLRRTKFTDSGKIRGIDWILSDLPSKGNSLQGETPPREKPALRTNNNKNYQQQEITTTSNKEEHSPAKAERSFPWESVIDYLNEKTNKNYHHTDANKRLLLARHKEGFTTDDMRRVIDNQCYEWLNDTSMNQYLRPSTLFRASKFEGYLNNRAPATHKPQTRKDWFG